MDAIEPESRIWIAGHRGLLGRALERRLRTKGHANLLTPSRGELDLTRQDDVEAFVARERPDYVFLAAGRVGGLPENQRSPADLIYENLAIQTAVMRAAQRRGVRGLLMFGSSCMYPREAPQPLAEEALWTGPLEPTSRAYATAKLAGVELCRAIARQHGLRFRVLIPATLYGPHDHFGTPRAHVVPALMERLHAAREAALASVSVLGTGRPRRELLHCDDAAEAACVLLSAPEAPDVANAGTGSDLPIAELARTLADVVGYAGELRFDASAPDGAPRKLLDAGRLRALGWRPRVALVPGLVETYAWYRKHRAEGRPA